MLQEYWNKIEGFLLVSEMLKGRTLHIFPRFKNFCGKKANLETIDYEIGNNFRSVDIKALHQIATVGDNEIPENDDCLASKEPLLFTFDRIFPSTSTQVEVFNLSTIPLLKLVLKGNDMSIMCLGQSGSGKSYTIMGEIQDRGKWGIIPRAFDYLFHEIQQSLNVAAYSLTISCFAITDDTIYDLIGDSHSKAFSLRRKGVNEGKHRYHGTEGLCRLQVKNIDDVEEVLSIGNNTKKNVELKSNSGNVQYFIESNLTLQERVDDINNTTRTIKSNLLFADFEGPETGVVEGTDIESLLSLFLEKSNSSLDFEFISGGLVDGSHLAAILKNSFGPHSNTSIIVNCSSDLDDARETIKSLKFAERIKKMEKDANAYGVGAADIEWLDESYWKKKYEHTLKKIIELETNMEISENSNTINNEALNKLKNDNLMLHGEVITLKKVIQTMKAGEIKASKNDSFSQENTKQKIEYLESEIEVLKKLLISKTDKIFDLESALEQTKVNMESRENSRIDDLIQQDSLKVIKEMSSTIQSQNTDLLRQVQLAEKLLSERSDHLQAVTNTLSSKNYVVENEQNEVDRKLLQMSRRLNNFSSGERPTSNRLNNVGNGELESKNNDVLNGKEIKKGLNLDIIKPF